MCVCVGGGGLQLLKFISPDSVIWWGENWRLPEKTNLTACKQKLIFLAHQIEKSGVLPCVRNLLSYTGPTSCYLTLVV